jgi:tetratricopeptide (TPR) repeat protein
LNWEPVEILVRKSRECLEARNFSACAEIARHILQMDPANIDATALLQQARCREDEQLQAELRAHNESIWQEAQQYFQAGNYIDCLPILNFLYELEPQDKLVQNQMQMCLQKLRGMGLDPAKVLSAMQMPGDDHASPDGLKVPNVPTLSKLPGGLSDASENAEIPGEAPLSGEEFTTPAPGISAEALSLRENSGRMFEWFFALQNPDVRRKVWIRSGAAAAILISLIILVRLLSLGLQMKPVETSFAVLVVNSTPTGAQVFVNEVPRGETNLQIDPIVPGNYEIRIEKAGFTPVMRYLPVNKGENANLSVQLEPAEKGDTESANSSQTDQDQIRVLFLQGKLEEANHECERILASDPRNKFVFQLRRAMRDQLLSKIRTEVQLQQWTDALANLKLALEIAPDDSELQMLRQQIPDKIKKDIDPPPSGIPPDNQKVQTLHRQIQKAISRGNFFPPVAGNAFDLLGKLQRINPSDSFLREKETQLSRTLYNQVNVAIQSRRMAEARERVHQGLTWFPEDPQLKALEKSIPRQSGSQVEDEHLWLQQAEQAMSAGRYLLPEKDNVLGYCNRILGVNPRHQRALQLKLEALSGALAQARTWVEKGQYEEATLNYQQLLLASSEKNLPYSPQELKNELAKSTFVSYPVIHDHGLLGKCSGKLRLNGYSLSYSPAEKSKDAFVGKFSDVVSVEGGDKVKIQFRDKTYRFSIDTGSRREESRRQTDLLFQNLLRNYLAAGKS